MANIFRTYKPRQFNFTPRFYDERKEALQDRIERIKREMGVEGEIETKKKGPYRTMSKGVMYEQMTKRRRAQRKSSLRLLIITAILVALAYYLLYR